MTLQPETKTALIDYFWTSFTKTLGITHLPFANRHYGLLKVNAQRIIEEEFIPTIEGMPYPDGITENDIQIMACENWQRFVATLVMNDGITKKEWGYSKKSIMTLSEAKKNNAYFELLEFFIFCSKKLIRLLSRPYEVKCHEAYSKFKWTCLQNLTTAKAVEMFQNLTVEIERCTLFAVENLILLQVLLDKIKEDHRDVFKVDFFSSEIFLPAKLSELNHLIFYAIDESSHIQPYQTNDDDPIVQFKQRVARSNLKEKNNFTLPAYRSYLFYFGKVNDNIKEIFRVYVQNKHLK